MYEYAVDRNSGQFKAPFNQIKNEPNVFTYKDTAIVTPNSDTPYSFVWMDLRAEPIVLSVPAVDTKRYYSVQALRRQHLQLRLHRYPSHRKRGRRLHGGRAGLEGHDPARYQEGVPLEHTVSLAGYRTQLFSPDDLDNVKKVQAGYKVQPLSAYLKQPAPPLPRGPSTFRRSTRNSSRRTSSNTSTSRCSLHPRKKTRRKYAPSLRASASGRARP